MKTVLIGTNNAAKLDFIGSRLHAAGIAWKSLADCGITYDVPETGTTYMENALLKATTYASLSGLPTIADDSGLEIDALQGAPGIYSARFAGLNKTDQEKALFVLEKLQSIPAPERTARFVSVIAYAEPHGIARIFEGISSGTIALTIQGAMHKNFPYYSIYIPQGYTQTISELVNGKIPLVLHRDKALAQCIEFLKNSGKINR